MKAIAHYWLSFWILNYELKECFIMLNGSMDVIVIHTYYVEENSKELGEMIQVFAKVSKSIKWS